MSDGVRRGRKSEAAGRTEAVLRKAERLYNSLRQFETTNIVNEQENKNCDHSTYEKLLLIAEMFLVMQSSQNRNIVFFKHLLFYKLKKKFLSFKERS